MAGPDLAEVLAHGVTAEATRAFRRSLIGGVAVLAYVGASAKLR